MRIMQIVVLDNPEQASPSEQQKFPSIIFVRNLVPRATVETFLGFFYLNKEKVS